MIVLETAGRRQGRVGNTGNPGRSVPGAWIMEGRAEPHHRIDRIMRPCDFEGPLPNFAGAHGRVIAI